MKKPELLAPAGSFEKAKTAFLYGADAVYAGTSQLSLRSRAEMDLDALIKTIEYAHNLNKKVYVAMNIYAPDNEYNEIIKQAKILNDIYVDGIIVADGGVLDIVKEYAPNIDIHMSTQSNIVSLHSSKFWYNNGTKRMILAREMNKYDIKHMIDNKPDDMELEIFVHGAICFSYSGRCLLSNFLAGRSANLGDCAQCCRWEYNAYIEEAKKPGILMPAEQDSKGTYIFASKDLCLIKEIPEIVEMGIDSLKIEGRLKTEYYLATIINVYRNAIDDYVKNPKDFNYQKYLDELDKTKTRGLTTLFFNDKGNEDIQDFAGRQISETHEFGGKVVGFNGEATIIEIKNRLVLNDEMEIIIPEQLEPYKFFIDNMYDFETDKKIDFINPGKLGQKVQMKLPIETKEGYIIRRKK